MDTTHTTQQGPEMLARIARIDHSKAAKQRAKVSAAIAQLAAAHCTALTATDSHGPASPQSLAAWETVETLGAIVHRQSRLLCGKPRGG